jgi:hypothetical protein
MTARNAFSWAVRSALPGARGAVAAVHPSAGLRMPEGGGAAADAPCAAQGVLAIAMPDARGLGGDVFGLVHGEAVRAVDGAGRAATEPDTDGGASIAAAGPGDGRCLPHGEAGVLPSPRALGPAIRHAREGLRAPPALAAARGAQAAGLVAVRWPVHGEELAGAPRWPSEEGRLMEAGHADADRLAALGHRVEVMAAGDFTGALTDDELRHDAPLALARRRWQGRTGPT